MLQGGRGERMTMGARGSILPASLLFLAGAVIIALILGGIVGSLSIDITGIILGVLVMAFILFLRQNELAIAFTMVASICFDWYLGTHFVALGTAALLLFILYLTRSSTHPWVVPRPLLLWLLFLGVCIIPAIRGATDTYNLAYYYPNIILSSFAVCWLGSLIARDVHSLRKLFIVVSIIASLIAIHIILEGVTGKLIFGTPNVENFLQNKENYHLFGSDDVYRIGSFFIQPDASSAFVAMMIFIPLGLFVESTSLLKRVFYLVEIALLIVALLFTYSTAAFLAVSVGVIAFMLLTGSLRHSVLMVLGIAVAVVATSLLFPVQVHLLFVHSSNPIDLMQRQGLWETAWQITLAFPFTGIGLSRLTYQVTVEHFRVATASISINNPHNSYLELSALGGIPVLAVFLALLTFCLWYALRNWYSVEGKQRGLFGGGIAAICVLIINSWSFGAWTLPPLAVSAWLIFGAIASPLIIRKAQQLKTQQQ